MIAAQSFEVTMPVRRIMLRGHALQTVRDHLEVAKAVNEEIRRLREWMDRAARNTVDAVVRQAGQDPRGDWGIDTQYLDQYGLAFLNGQALDTGETDEPPQDPDNPAGPDGRRLH